MSEMTKEQEEYAGRLASEYPTVRCVPADATGSVALVPGTCDADDNFTALGLAHVVAENGVCVRHEVTA